MKIISVVGARPQFIKCAALTRELQTEYSHVIVHTGQHYDFDLSGVFFDELNIPEPEYNLGVGSGTHGYQIGQTLIAAEEVLSKEKPDLTLVYGDTNSTLAGALAASRLHIPVGHVEAGIRTGDKKYPEEINRTLTDHCSDLNFCSTKASVNNLNNENISSGVYLTGDVMVDILLRLKAVAEKSSILQDLNLTSKQYLLVTIHRPDSTDDSENLKNIVDALCQIDQTIVFTAHPRTVDALRRDRLYNKISEHKKIKIIKPVGYLESIKLMSDARKVITDSGGMQKEAYVLKVPCVTMCEVSVWPETVEDGWNVLVGTDTQKIVDMARNFEPTGEQKEDFGKGEACKNIKKIIDSMWK